MSKDILGHLQGTNQNPDIEFTPNMYNEATGIDRRHMFGNR